MTLEEITTAIRQLDDQTFDALSDEMFTMREERRTRPQVEQAQADLITELQEAGKLEKPEAATEDEAKEHADKVPEWRDPGTDHSKMYHQGDVVRHKGKLVRSTHAGLNSWAPGTLNYDGRIWEILETPETSGENTGEDAAETPTALDYKQPTGGHDAYQVGDKVMFEGEVWESTIANNVWSPSAYPTGWKKL